jgi:hypothetical protein
VNKEEKIILAADKLTDILLLTLLALQEISGKTQEEVLAAIEQEGKKTDALLDQLL